MIPEEERSEFAFKIGLDLGFPNITADELKSWFINAGWDADKFVTFRKINNGMRCAQLGYKFDNGCRVVIEYLSDLSIYTPDWFLSYDYDNSMYGNYYYIVVIGGIVADVYKSRSTKHLWLKRIPTINEITDFWKDK